MAARECKELIATVYGRSVDADTALRHKTAEIIAQLRAGEEGQEGLQAFLEKRKPSWVKEA